MADENGADALDDAPQGGADTGALDTGQPDDNTQQPDKSFDLEDFAGSMGWAPKDQWRGDPDAWKPAEDFVRGTVSVNQSLSKKLKNLERNQGRMAQSVERIAEQRIADARAELEAQLDRAVDEGDRATVKHVTTQIARLDQAPSVAGPPPEAEEFVARNASWFDVDPDATDLARRTAEMLAKKGVSVPEQLEKAEEVVRRRFPELFADKSAPRQQGKGPAAVHTADTRSAPRQQRGPKGFAELPADAKQQCLRMEAKGRCTRDEYAKHYWEEENA